MPSSPWAPFFRLRQVCKEWNRLASDRQFLEHNFKSLISSNPYFVLTRPSGRHILLTSEGSSWSSTPVPRARCEVSGLLFEDSDCNRVFDLHTRVFHTLPPLPLVQLDVSEIRPRRPYFDLIHYDFLTLMSVDTTVIPYEFRVIIIEDEIIGAQIYNWNGGAWMHKLSPNELPAGPTFDTSCVHYNKSLYITLQDEDNGHFVALSYDLERDEWDCHNLGSSYGYGRYRDIDIGVWQDRWFLFVVKKGKKDHVSKLEVVESLSNFEKPWVAFDSLPRDLCEWMMSATSNDLTIMTKLCGEHVLFYHREEPECEMERTLLYNLDRKTWDKIELPRRPR